VCQLNSGQGNSRSAQSVAQPDDSCTLLFGPERRDDRGWRALCSMRPPALWCHVPESFATHGGHGRFTLRHSASWSKILRACSSDLPRGPAGVRADGNGKQCGRSRRPRDCSRPLGGAPPVADGRRRWGGRRGIVSLPWQPRSSWAPAW
jgi:hypothetical protein